MIYSGLKTQSSMGQVIMDSKFNSELVSEADNESCDRAKALKDFDGTKAGVKGLVDAGITKLPQIFHTPPEEISSMTLQEKPNADSHVPTIDLRDIDTDPLRRNQAAEAIKQACEVWGFFQVINHGVAQETLDEILKAVRRFHEESNEAKAEFYTRDRTRKVRFDSNFDLYQSKAASWRDTLFFTMAPVPPQPHEFPPSCRDIMPQYDEGIRKLGQSLLELVSEALGLDPNYLKAMDCEKQRSFICHYYPPCPEPDRTLGHVRHTDPDFLTVLLQDQTGGLQVLHQNHWIDVSPLEGALVVNVGDFLQLVSNDKFKSVEHRVVAKSTGSRISVACFFTPQIRGNDKVYGPIKDLLTDETPVVFKDTLTANFFDSFTSLALGDSPLDLLRL